jgi:predicted O-methyltransferase YrrM
MPKAESHETLQAYDDYIGALFAQEDEALVQAREDMRGAGLPEINVSPAEGKLLHTLALSVGARRILEIGTLGGYSAIWMARALPRDGRLITLEIDPHHAAVAKRNVDRAGLSHVIDVRVGPAAASLRELHAASEDAFDVAFIDADKDSYVEYLGSVLPLVREGGLILGDNTLPSAVLDKDGDSGTKRYNAAVAARSDLVSVVAPVLRGGIDGLSISVKRQHNPHHPHLAYGG